MIDIICIALVALVAAITGYVLGWIHGSRPLDVKSDAWRAKHGGRDE